MEPTDEFSEFDVSEDEIDAMLAAGEPVRIVTPLDLQKPGPLWVSVSDAPCTYGASGVSRTLDGAKLSRRADGVVTLL
ncbi:hypothetical protein ACWCQP_29100 [Streptomyces chartreusis]